MRRKTGAGFKFAKYLLLIYTFIGVLAPFIAGEMPIISIFEDKVEFPVLNAYFNSDKIQKADFEKYKTATCIMPLIPYSSQTIDHFSSKSVGPFDNQQVSSLQYRHWIGTDKLGRDVAAGMIYGASTSLKIGLISVFFSFLFGVTLGISSAYYNNELLKFNAVQIIFGISAFCIGIYYSFYEYIIFHSALFLFILLISINTVLITVINKYFLSKLKLLKFNFPMDIIIVKLIEIRKSIPGLFLVLGLITIFSKPSIWNIIIIITLLGWTEFARFARAETLAVREENYILSAKVLGFSNIRIIYHHILPNIMTTLWVVICFNIAGAILMESTLSFLGIGLPVEEVSWGKILAEGRDMRSWWLVVFPGLSIFLVVLSFNTIISSIQNHDALR